MELTAIAQGDVGLGVLAARHICDIWLSHVRPAEIGSVLNSITPLLGLRRSRQAAQRAILFEQAAHIPENAPPKYTAAREARAKLPMECHRWIGSGGKIISDCSQSLISSEPVWRDGERIVTICLVRDKLAY